MIKLRPLFFLLVLVVVAGGWQSLSMGRVAAPPDDASGLLIAWETPPWQLTAIIGDDGHTYTRVQIQEQDTRWVLGSDGSAPGWPRLPTLGALVALPSDGDFSLELVDMAYDTLSLHHPVEPTSAPAPVQLDEQGQPLPGGRTWTRDETVYASDGPFPAQFATLGEAVWMRDHRLVRLTIAPFRYHPDQQTLDLLRRLRLRVRWDPPQDSPPPASRAGTLDDLLVDLVLNPDDLDSFRAPTQPTNQPTITPPVLTAGSVSLSRGNQLTTPSYKILVESKGIYALDYTTLITAGVPVTQIDPSGLQLTHAGDPIAAQWEGDDDALFEADERLLFYARPQQTRYAGHDVYWLAWGGEAGGRMATRSGDPAGLPSGTAWATARFEENVEYDPQYQDQQGDRWFWRRLKLPDLVSDTFTLSLETPAVGTKGELNVWLRGFTRAAPNPDHHVRLDLNGSEVGEVWWDGERAYTATLALPAGRLQGGDNAVTLHLPGDTGADIEGAWVDALAVTYGLSAVSGDIARFGGQDSAATYTVGGFSHDAVRVYDVTDPLAPRIVEGSTVAGGSVQVGDHGSTPAQYLILTDDRIKVPQAIVPTRSLSDPPGGADYVIVTHPDFAAALAPLAAWRAEQGLRVSIVDVEAIYDRFGDGRMDPAAIRSFLAHAYANWSGEPLQYALLVGDGTYDPHGYRPDSQPTWLPPFLAPVDPWLGETAADNRYADLTDDLLPELRLGRLPVNTLAEAQAIVDKILRYETDPLPGDWNRRLLFGADNPSTAGDHHADADSEFTTYVTPTFGYQGTRVYLSQTAGAPHLYTEAEAAQDALIAELNRGALLYTYFGHASWHQEAVLETDGYAPLFHRDHIAQLNNVRRWPVVLHMTCLTGRYIAPHSDTLDESLLRTPDVGAIAVWGASGYGVATGHRGLHRSFYRAVFDDGQVELGTVTHAALVHVFTSGANYDLIDTFHLFGDPAMALNMTIRDLPFSLFLPIIRSDLFP